MEACGLRYSPNAVEGRLRGTVRALAAAALCGCLLCPWVVSAEATGKETRSAVADGADVQAAWVLLEDSASAGRKPAQRLPAIAALALLGGVPRAEKMMEKALLDGNLDVRLAAVVAAGEMARAGGPRDGMIVHLRNLLNDTEPAVAFTAANALWKMGDVSGEDILVAVAEGERSATDGLWKSTRHNASRELHDPESLAKIGAMQGISMLVPPLGMGMGAYQYLRGNSGGTNPRVTAVTELGKEKNDAVRGVLIGATKDKDAGVRLAAAEALAQYRGAEVRSALETMLTDGKENVRLTANAAFLRVALAPAEMGKAPVVRRGSH